MKARTTKPKAKVKAKPRSMGSNRKAPTSSDASAVQAFYAKQPPHLREILLALRSIVDRAVPDATPSMKWGMSFYTLEGKLTLALAGFKKHVSLLLVGPRENYPDPKRLLVGDMQNGRRLQLMTMKDLPRAQVASWAKAAGKRARAAARA